MDKIDIKSIAKNVASNINKKNLTTVANKVADKFTKAADVVVKNAKKVDTGIPMTFDVSKVKSTVTNPSKVFKWISVEDEQKIRDKVEQLYPNWTTFEKQQAVQWLYNAALTAQKQKDIDAWRQQIKLDLISKANEYPKNTKNYNIHYTKVKKADLADLIKDQYYKNWYKPKDLMNLTDEWVIAWFLKSNPDYKDAFNKYFYNNDDAIQLWKDLGWIEKSWWEKAWDKVEAISEWMAGWMPKWWEWVRDLLDWGLAWTDYNIDREKSLENTAFMNYIQEKYWTVPANMTERDLEQARKDFEASKEENKKEYTPTAWSAFTKMAMWLADIAFTAWWLKWASYWSKFLTSWLGKNIVRNNLFKLWFSTAGNFDLTSRAPEALWDWLSWAWSNINELPWFKQIRDSLQTEQDKADWDAFVAWNMLSLFRAWKRNVKNIKDADVQWWKKSFDEVKKWNIQEWVNTLKENAKENRQTKMEQDKLNAAQKVTQWEIETSKTASRWLDLLNEEWKLDKIKNVDGLQKNVDETVDRLKKEQTDIAKWEEKRFSQADLWLQEEADILDSKGNKSTQKVVSYPIDTLLDRIIEHYKEVDNTKAETYKSYKRALKNWTLPAETILEIRREGNSLNQKVYNNKTNQYKDTDKAQQWAKNMEKVNGVIENLDIWEELRKRDSQLSSLYTIQEWLRNIKKAEANFKKKAIKESPMATWLWKTVSRVLGKLSFGTSNFLSKALVSALQESLWASGFVKTSYNALEIAQKVPEFVKDYQNLLKKIEWEPVSKNQLTKIINWFINKWDLEAQYNEEEDN